MPSAKYRRLPFRIFEVRVTNPRTKKNSKWILPAVSTVHIQRYLSSGTPLRVTHYSEIKGANAAFMRSQIKPPTPKQLLEFFNNVGTSINHAVNPLQAIFIHLRSIKSMREKAFCFGLIHHLLQGKEISWSLHQLCPYLDGGYLALIRGGEQTGQLGSAFLDVAQLFSARNKLQKQVIAALTYPGIVLGLATLVCCLFVIFFLPKLTGVYDSFDTDLPYISQKVFGVGEFLVAKPWVMILFAAGVILFLFQLPRIIKFKFLHIIGLKIPLIKTLILTQSLTRCCFTTGSLIASSISLPESLRIGGQASGNFVISRAFSEIATHLEQGEGLISAFYYHADVFGLRGQILAGLVEIGEQSGALEDTFSRFATTCKEEFEFNLDIAQKILPIIVLLFITAVVGLLVASIFIPIFSFGKVLMENS